MRAENDLLSVWGSIDLFFVGVVGIDLVLYEGRKSRGFSVSIEIDLILEWVSRLT